MVKYMSRPLLLVALGYMDPGNWATAIEGGSRFGFELLWVVVVSNALALLFQTLATRLELVTGKHLAQVLMMIFFATPNFPFGSFFALLQLFLEILYLKHVKIQDLLVYT
jgi:NRAMP (natural resistance-associated macrophage protein)-like metal ion transporter